MRLLVFACLCAAVAAAQSRPTEESLTPERFQSVHAPLLQPRAAANTVWKNLMGYGIVEPFDEFDLARQDPASLPEGWTVQPTHPELLDELARDFEASGYSLKHLFRRIASSSAYQLSAAFPGEWREAYRAYFARKFVRMLSAEELHDAIAISTSRPGKFNFGDDTVGMAMQLSQPQGGGGARIRSTCRGLSDSRRAATRRSRRPGRCCSRSF